MEDAKFISKLPLALGVFAGGLTWLVVVFFLAAGFLDGLRPGKTAEVFLGESRQEQKGRPAASGRPEPACHLEEISLSGYCSADRERKGFAGAGYTCSNGYQGVVESGCLTAAVLLAQAERACRSCPGLETPAEPSAETAPLPPSASPEPGCIQEGQVMPVYPGYSCCPGLIAIPDNYPDEKGSCQTLLGASICARCGDGVCGLGENECNCGADCSNL